MKKVKEFYKKHETKILVAGGIVLLVVAVKHRKYVKALEKQAFQYAGKEVISWYPTKARYTLGAVKEFLDLNKDNDSVYAIVKDGGHGYMGVVLNGSNAAYYQG
jgi:hypothetical protein